MMKIPPVIFLILFTTFSKSLWSQEQKHLFSDGKVTSAFGSFILEGAKVGEVNTLLYGFDGGLSVNKVSMGTYYLCSSDSDDGNGSFSYWHTGLTFGYNHGNHRIIHPYSNVKIGFGRQKSVVGLDEIGETVLVVKPSLGIELNVYQSMKMAFLASYNYLSKFDNKAEIATVDTNGMSFGVYFTWGWWD